MVHSACLVRLLVFGLVCPLMQLPLSPRVENRGGRLLLTYTEQGSI